MHSTLTLLERKVDHRVQVASLVELRHLRRGVQAEIVDPQSSHAAARRVKHGNLHVNALVVRQLVVVLDLDRYGFVAIDARQLNVRGVGHVQVAVEVGRPDAGRGAHAHHHVERDRSADIVDDVGDQSLAVDVRLGEVERKLRA